jgi:hypothetical protein
MLKKLISCFYSKIIKYYIFFIKHEYEHEIFTDISRITTINVNIIHM